MQPVLPDPSLPWPICWEAVALIARAEGLRLKAYRCVAGVLTIGYGETEGVTPQSVWTKEQADQRLLESLTARAAQVETLCTVFPTAHQLGAMVSLSYNIGIEGLHGSSVLRAHNADQPDAAARAFSLWNKAKINGVLTVVSGLTARRAAEAALYLKPDDEAPQHPMPQAVMAESSLAASPISQAGAVTGIAGGVTVLQSISGQVHEVFAQVRDAVEPLGLQPMTMLGICLLAAGGVGVYWRLQQRKGGFA